VLLSKKIKWLAGISLSLLVVATPLAARELVIAIENTLQASSSLDAMARSQMLVRNLKTAGVPQAMFLIKTENMGAKNRERVALYSNQGHLLVNAGHDHSLVSKSDLYAYEIGILKANRLLSPFPGYQKHIHFSYLHEAGDLNIPRGLTDFLRERGYKAAFTGFNPARGIDTYINQLYQTKVLANRRVDMVALEKAYIQLMLQPLQQQDAYLFNMLGYSPRQVLVVQENDLAAYFMVGLVDELVARGWKMVAAEKALNDPLANPMALGGWGANSYLHGLTGLPEQPVAYPRVIGPRKAGVDQVLNQLVPGFIE
jgi:hypothetical protein